MVCLTHVYMADIKNLLVLLNAQEGKHPCSKRLPFPNRGKGKGRQGSFPSHINSSGGAISINFSKSQGGKIQTRLEWFCFQFGLFSFLRGGANSRVELTSLTVTSSCYETSRKSWKPGRNTRQANLFTEKHELKSIKNSGENPGCAQYKTRVFY